MDTMQAFAEMINNNSKNINYSIETGYSISPVEVAGLKGLKPNSMIISNDGIANNLRFEDTKVQIAYNVNMYISIEKSKSNEVEQQFLELIDMMYENCYIESCNKTWQIVFNNATINQTDYIIEINFTLIGIN